MILLSAKKLQLQNLDKLEKETGLYVENVKENRKQCMFDISGFCRENQQCMCSHSEEKCDIYPERLMSNTTKLIFA